jgi:MscS family membrane protein
MLAYGFSPLRVRQSLQLRKRLLELAHEKISRKLVSFGISFTMQEPTIYVDSLITL